MAGRHFFVVARLGTLLSSLPEKAAYLMAINFHVKLARMASSQTPPPLSKKGKNHQPF